MNLYYKISSFYLVTSLSIYLKDNMTCCTNDHSDEIIFLSSGEEKVVLEEWLEIS